MMIFGPAGVPLRCKEKGTLEGLDCTAKLKLRAFEMEFVQGVRMKEPLAREVGKKAKELKLSLSAHGPYFINLLSEEKEKRIASVERIMQTARACNFAGAKRAVFHPAYYGKMEKKKAYEEVKEEFAVILQKVKEEKLDVVIAPEVTGKGSQFGNVEELFALAKHFGIERVNPCIDWSHVHARDNGRLKSKKNYGEVFEAIEGFGKHFLKSLHCHFQSVKYSAKGELSHLELRHNEPAFKPLAELLVERNCSGTIISESPNIENDALEMQGIYASLL